MDYVPAKYQKLWDKVKVEARSLTENATLALRIADGAVDELVNDGVSTRSAPRSIEGRKRKAWAAVYKAALACDLRQEQAYRLASSCALATRAHKATGEFILSRPGSLVQVSTKNIHPLSPQFEQLVVEGLQKLEPEQSYSERNFQFAVKGLGALTFTELEALPARDAAREYQLTTQDAERVLTTVRAIKSATSGWVEGYLATWGSNKDADLQGEYFTPRTDFCLDWYAERPALYHHGMDKSGPGLAKVGALKAVLKDDLGLWVQAQLDMRDRYAAAVYDMVKAKEFGWSSGSVDHLVKVADTGEIVTWPLIEGSITPTPAQPAKTTVRAFKAVVGNLGELHAKADDAIGLSNFVFDQSNGGLTMSYKQALRYAKQMNRTLGLKLTEDELQAVATDMEEDALATDEEAFAMDEQDPYAMDEEDAFATDEEDAYAMDDEEALMADIGYAMDDEDAMMFDDEEAFASDDEDAMMFDDEEAMMQDEEEPVMSYRSRRARRSLARSRSRRPRSKAALLEDVVLNQQRQLRTQRKRIKALELMEAPGARRNFAPMQVTDQADVKGAYKSAFVAYLAKGLAGMYDHEKYTLNAKGKQDFGPATMEFDRETGRVGSVKTYITGSDASFGYGVPEDWVNELNKNVMVQAVTAAECRTRTTTSDALVQPDLVTTDARRAHAANVSWPGETPASTDHVATEDTLAQIRIPVHVMLISNTVSLSALEDLAFDFEANLTEAYSEAVSVAYEELIYSGNGQGKLEGIITNTSVTGSASSGVSTVSGYLATGSATSFVNGDVFKQAWSHLPPGYRARAKWVMNSNTAFEVATLKDGNGNYLFNPRGDDYSGSSALPNQLFKNEIIYNEWASDIAANAFPVVLADLSRAYTIARRVEFSVRRFDDSTPALQDQVQFLGRARIGGQVTQAAAIKVIKIAVS